MVSWPRFLTAHILLLPSCTFKRVLSSSTRMGLMSPWSLILFTRRLNSSSGIPPGELLLVDKLIKLNRSIGKLS